MLHAMTFAMQKVTARLYRAQAPPPGAALAVSVHAITLAIQKLIARRCHAQAPRQGAAGPPSVHPGCHEWHQYNEKMLPLSSNSLGSQSRFCPACTP